MEVREATELNESDLQAVAYGQVWALRVPGFFDVSEATALATALRSSPLRSHYEVNPQVAKIGSTLFDSNGRQAERAAFLRQAAANLAIVRDACAGIEHPVDRIRRQLDERGALGTAAECLDGVAMSYGVFRILEARTGIAPHRDVLREDAPDSSGPCDLRAQLSVNVHLTNVEAGGDLMLWPIAGRALEVGPGSPHHLDVADLPRPVASLTPSCGDLIAFRSTLAHAVQTVGAGCRVTCGTFVGYRGPRRPWTFWS